MESHLLAAMEASDVTGSLDRFDRIMAQNGDPWDVHLSLFPLVQKVTNPPYINPHLPKMYRIIREFRPVLEPEELRALVRLEVSEYARRPKREEIVQGELPEAPVSFDAIEAALARQDREETARLLAAFGRRSGRKELARRLLLLGSGYLHGSLGHSISCTAFILLEMLERDEQEVWPAIATLADYFIRGRFDTTPDFNPEPLSKEELDHHLLRAASGRGIVNLHHPITLYAIERVRSLLTDEEVRHLIRSWIDFLGDKESEPVERGGAKAEPLEDYAEFYRTFASLHPRSTLECLAPLFDSDEGRLQIKRFLIKGVCDQYQGEYNPHHLTGLGSALWLLDRYRSRHPVAIAGLYQYLDYFFGDLKS